jgi:hypothetical protein
MRSCLRLWAAVLAAATLAWSPAHATTEYEYAKGEDVVIDSGLAPNGRLALASHGEGSSGNDKFHIYLMAEPAHRRIAILDDITTKDILDSGPTAFHASWAPDSGHAAVAFRTDRHVMITMLYRIERRRAVGISGPSLFKDVTNRDLHASNDDERTRITRLSWHGPRRFLLTEYRLFITSSPNLLRSLGRYGRQTGDAGDQRFFVKFSAQAVCEIVNGNRYRIVDLKPGDFND